MTNQNRIYGLDILRAMAILFVMLSHSIDFFPYSVKNLLNYAQSDGVGIFFVLSGFLIGRILIKHFEDKKPIIDFWKKRWMRTLPAYYFVLIILTIIALIWHNHSHIIRYYFFMQNIAYKSPDFFSEAWSLSVEEIFYLSTPLIMYGLIKLKYSTKNAFISTAAFLLLFSFIFRIVRYAYIQPLISDPVEWHLIYRGQVLTTLDSLAFGLIGAFISHYYYNRWIKYKKILLFAGIVLLFTTQALLQYNDFSFYFCVWHFTLVSIAVLLMLPFLSELKTGKGITFRFFTFISIISYSMYLLNLRLIREYGLSLINDYLPEDQLRLIKLVLFWSLTIGLSYLSYKFIEQPFIRLRDYKPIIRRRITAAAKQISKT